VHPDLMMSANEWGINVPDLPSLYISPVLLFLSSSIMHSL